MIKRAIIIVLIVICGVIAFHIVTRMLEGEEEKLKRTIYNCKILAEKEKLLVLSNYISPDYSDEFNNDKELLMMSIRDVLARCRNISLVINKLEIKTEEEIGVAWLQITGYWQEGGSKDIIYDKAEVKAEFRKEQGDWKLTRMEFSEPEKMRELFTPLFATVPIDQIV